MEKQRLVVLSGAGISAESGISTFRDAGGLWEGHDVMEVASPQGFKRNPELVLEFYNQRRRQLHEVAPNDGHKILAELEHDFDVHIITQNVDNLHERAGSSQVLHLHGELFKVRSQKNPDVILDWTGDLSSLDRGPDGAPLRPHIVWFGEEVPALAQAVELAATADIFVVVGTSLQVYPAAGLLDLVPRTTTIYYVDPQPAAIPNLRNPLVVIAEKASTGMAALRERLRG